MKTFVVPALSVFISLLLFNLAHVSAQFNNQTDAMGEPEGQDTASPMPVVDQTAEEGNGTVMQIDPPELVVMDAASQPCMLVTINSTLRISYRVRPEAVQDSYIAIVDIPLPISQGVSGECGKNVNKILYQWDNSTFQVNLTLKLKDVSKSKDINATASWSLTDVAIHFDLSNEDAFPGAKESKNISVARHQLELFETPKDMTLMCDREINVQIGQDEPGVTIIFNHIRLAAFGVTSEEYPQEIVECQEKSFMRPDDDIVVPLIVACSLSVVVILVVVAYAISRKIAEARDQSQYKPMP